MGSLFRRLRAALRREPPVLLPGLADLRLRPMAHSDLRAVAAIEGASFASPWRLSSYTRAVEDPNYHFSVGLLDGRLVAYAGFWVEGGKAHIAKVAVHPDHRRRGIGSVLLERLLDQARRLGLPEAYLEVRRSNVGAQALYRRFGFRLERVQPRAYPNDLEDALVFVRDDLLEVKRQVT